MNHISWMGAPKDLGDYPICWASATVTCLETVLREKHRINVKLSVKELTNSFARLALEFIARNGIAIEKPHNAFDGNLVEHQLPIPTVLVIFLIPIITSFQLYIFDLGDCCHAIFSQMFLINILFLFQLVFPVGLLRFLFHLSV